MLLGMPLFIQPECRQSEILSNGCWLNIRWEQRLNLLHVPNELACVPNFRDLRYILCSNQTWRILYFCVILFALKGAEPIPRSEKLYNITTTHTYFTSNGERPFAWVRHSLRATHIRNTCVTHKQKSSSHPITKVSF